MSMSLPNASSKYVYSLIRYANLAKLIMPEWTLRVYVAKNYNISERIVQKLFSLKIEIMLINSEEFTSTVPHQLWKYLVLKDDTVDMFVIRRTEGSLLESDWAILQNWLRNGHRHNPLFCVPDLEVGTENNTLPNLQACTWVGKLEPLRNNAVLQYFSQKMLNFSNRFTHRHPQMISGRTMERYFAFNTLGTLSDRFNKTFLVQFNKDKYGVL